MSRRHLWWSAALALAACSVATFVVLRWSPMVDLTIYRLGAGSAARGERFYDLHYVESLPFTYPPFAAIVFRPLAWLSNDALRVAMLLTSIAALVVAIAATLRATGVAYGRTLITLTLYATALAVCLEPIKQTLRLGQVNLLLLALVALDVLWVPARWRGVGVGLATGLKLTPAIFIAYFAVTRQWRAATTSVVTFAATIGLGFVVMPDDAHRVWFDRLFLDSQRIGDVGYVANQSIEGALLRVTHDHAPALVAIAISVVVAAAGLLVASRLHRAGREVDAFLTAAVVGLVVSPISWSHHWVAVALIAAVALSRAVIAHSRRALALLVAIVAVFLAWPFPAAGESTWAPNGLIWLAPRTNRRGVDWSVLQQLAGNVELVAGLALVSLAVFSARRRTA